MKRSISILGCTGSIGISTLEVARQFPDRFRVVALACATNYPLLKEQILEFQPEVVAVLNESVAEKLRESLAGEACSPRIWVGDAGYREAAVASGSDILVSAMVGAAGLLPTLAAIEAGKTIALANKETLVVGGEIVMRAARDRNVTILPVDSEHSAIFQSLQGNHRESLRRILLTASGDTIFKRSRAELEKVTPEEALRHPNWSMGRKITIDSATLMNKGLEVIEACWLFGVPVEQVTVHIHPESIIHSMVEYVDGSVIAQLGIPDMKIPIAYALSYPDRLPVAGPRLDLFALQKLTFFPPDVEKFPCLRLAFEACKTGSTMPAVLNAANEIAVEAFLDRRIGFLEIPELIESVMHSHDTAGELTLDAVLSADAWARDEARRRVQSPKK